jgi:hypothetical protein
MASMNDNRPEELTAEQQGMFDRTRKLDRGGDWQEAIDIYDRLAEQLEGRPEREYALNCAKRLKAMQQAAPTSTGARYKPRTRIAVGLAHMGIGVILAFIGRTVWEIGQERGFLVAVHTWAGIVTVGGSMFLFAGIMLCRPSRVGWYLGLVLHAPLSHILDIPYKPAAVLDLASFAVSRSGASPHR